MLNPWSMPGYALKTGHKLKQRQVSVALNLPEELCEQILTEH